MAIETQLTALLIAFGATALGFPIHTMVRRGLRQHRWKMALKESLASLVSTGLLVWCFSLLTAIVFASVALATYLPTILTDNHPQILDWLNALLSIATLGTMVAIIVKLPLSWKPKYSPDEQAILDTERRDFDTKHPRIAGTLSKMQAWANKI